MAGIKKLLILAALAGIGCADRKTPVRSGGTLLWV